MGKLEKKVVVKLDGGLGNQLFQWAHGYKLAKLNNASLFFDDKENKKNQSKINLRPILLSQLGIKVNYYKPNSLEKFSLLSSYFNRKSILIKENRLEYLPNSIKTYNEDKIITQGYWQSINYFKDLTEEIKQIITLKGSKKNKTIGVHLRRGDYVNDNSNASIYRNLTEGNYYQSAINAIKSKYDGYKFLVFSDDIEWCKNYFDSKEFEFSSNTTVLDDFYDLALCEHQIIANSTFSWWAAWLNPNKNKMVIVPKKWFLNNWAEKEFLLEEWIQI